MSLGFAACRSDDTPPTTPTSPPAATVVPSPTPIPTELPVAILEWRDCGSLECTEIEVPLDYADPAKGSITLPLIRRTASDPDNRIGSLLVNPGGPGVSGVDFVEQASGVVPAAVRERFDVVAWDPRGVAGSEPAVDCVDDLDAYANADPSVDTVEEQAAQDAEARRIAEGCEARSGDLLPYLATEYTARDMDRIRAALGDEKLTYLGYSYGTFLGAIYADLFPTNIRAMVLDAAADPSLPTTQDIKNQVIGFERSLDAFLADCAADPSCAFYSNANPGAAFDALMEDIETEPLTGDSSTDVGQGLAWLGVASALYNEASWPSLADALVAAQEGDGGPLLELSSFITGRIGPNQYTNELEQRVAILCVDGEQLTLDEKLQLQSELAVEAPRYGKPGIGPSGDPCDFWPVSSERVPKPIAAPGSPPIVVVGTTGDPATPYQQAVALADQLSAGVLVTYEGERHTAYGGVSACIDDPINTYLIDLIPPPDGLTC